MHDFKPQERHYPGLEPSESVFCVKELENYVNEGDYLSGTYPAHVVGAFNLLNKDKVNARHECWLLMCSTRYPEKDDVQIDVQKWDAYEDYFDEKPPFETDEEALDFIKKGATQEHRDIITLLAIAAVTKIT